tara:strand:+ start:411 stop:803 length:393 start_codon:yes stop_codon:yes gene_type:complete
MEKQLLSIGYKLIRLSKNLDIKTLIIIIIGISILFLFISSTALNILNPTTIFISVVLSVIVFLWVSKFYKRKLHMLNIKNKFLQKTSILEELCDSDDLSKNNKKLCSQYLKSKTNFDTISGILLNKLNIK